MHCLVGGALRIIETDADVLEGAVWLAALDPRFAVVLDQTGLPPLRRRENNFSALMSAVVAQQVSKAAASTIWMRVKAAGLDIQANVVVASESDLKSVGLSRSKVPCSKALAESLLDYRGLYDMTDNNVIKELCKNVGIGTWTAEVYALASLGRQDVFPHGDLALQEAAKALFTLNVRPDEKQMRIMALEWSPWRAVAARLLWAYYSLVKDKKGNL